MLQNVCETVASTKGSRKDLEMISRNNQLVPHSVLLLRGLIFFNGGLIFFSVCGDTERKRDRERWCIAYGFF